MSQQSQSHHHQQRRRRTNAPLIPVVVVCGFLGAGKTTLLNRLLGAAGEPSPSASPGMSSSTPSSAACSPLPNPLLIVNDFNDINVDAMMLQQLPPTGDSPPPPTTTTSSRGAGPHDGVSAMASAYHVRDLSGGCICCTLLKEFIDAVADAVEPTLTCTGDAATREVDGAQFSSPFNCIVVESTGMADPLPIAMALTCPTVDSRLKPLLCQPPPMPLVGTDGSEGEELQAELSSEKVQATHDGATGGGGLYLDAMITVVDAISFDPANDPLHATQVEHVNVVVLSKFDELTQPQPQQQQSPAQVRDRVTALVSAIRRINTHCLIYPAVFGNIGPPVARSEAQRDDESLTLWLNRVVQGTRSAPVPRLLPSHFEFFRQGSDVALKALLASGWEDDGIPESTKYGFTTWYYPQPSSSPPFDEKKLIAAVSSGAALHGVCRSKGYIRMLEAPLDGEDRTAAAAAGAVETFLWSSVGRRFSYAKVEKTGVDEDTVTASEVSHVGGGAMEGSGGNDDVVDEVRGRSKPTQSFGIVFIGKESVMDRSYIEKVLAEAYCCY